MSTSPDSAIVAAGVGATFHLLRLAADLISTANDVAKKNDDKIENSKPKEGEDAASASAAGGGANGQFGRRSSLQNLRLSFSTTNFNGRLSMRNMDYGNRNGTNGTRRSSFFSKRGSSRGMGASGAAAASTANGVTDVETAGNGDKTEEPKTGIEAIIPIVSLVIHVILFAYFLSATILTATSTPESRPEFANAIYDEVPLGCALTSVFLGIIMNLRDFQRKRFTSLQRGLYSISALILLVGCIVMFALPPTDEIVDYNPTKVDIVTLVFLVIYAVLAITEGRVCRYPTVTSKEGKKAKLNKRALMTILKPYFWPHATHTSATINRIRAITTWFCVAGSKACSLTAPIFLGKASTALTRGDYDGAIRYSIYYSILQLSASTCKELQSLVYLKVAQAAFVQLSEVSFNHLHSLSLDWHLRKKLGETIRSMDRGIAACDNLMKYLFLWMAPAIAEMILVTIIFATYFDYFPLAVTVFFFVFTYMTWTILVTLWRKKFRKQVAKSDNDWHDICTDSLVNFETVKYFTAEEYEKKR